VLVWPALAEALRLHGVTCSGAWYGVPQEDWEAMAAPR
jgi:hypothetical protein